MKASSSNAILTGTALAETAWSPWHFADLAQRSVVVPVEAGEPEAAAAEIEPRVEDVSPAEAEAAIEPGLSYPTAAELEAIHQEAWQAGFEAGRAAGEAAGLEAGRQAGEAAGHAAAMAAVQQQFADAWTPLARLSESLEAEIAQLEPVLAEDVLQLAVMLAGKLVGSELITNPAVLEPLLREALLALPTNLKAARLRVNPADLAVARRFLEHEAPQTVWQWVEDPAIERGGCLVDSEGARLDLTLARRRQTLAAALGLTGQESDDARAD